MLYIAIIGAGRWGANVIRNFRDHPSVSIRYICEKNTSQRKLISTVYKDIPIVSNYRQILNDRKIEAIVLVTPTSTHYKLGMDALKANKHLFVEKPIATSVSECLSMIWLAKKKKRILFIGHTFKYNNGIRKVKEFIDKQKLGKIQYISVIRTNLGPVRNDVNVMWDLAPHDMSIINYWLNSNPFKVSAIEGKFLNNKLSDMAILNFSYPKNIIASVHVSWLNPKKTREITIVTNKEMLIWNDLDLLAPIRIYNKIIPKKRATELIDTFTKYHLNLRNINVITPKVKHNEPLATECDHFIDCVKANKNPLTDGIDGLNVVKALEAASKSIERHGRPVRL